MLVKKLKGILSVVLCVGMLSGIAGCTSSTAATTQVNSDTTTAATASAATTTGAANANFAGDSSKEFYMVTFLSGYPYWKDCFKGFESAAKQFGVTAVYGGSTEYDVNDAITTLEQIIAKHPAGIAISCMDADAYAPVIDKAIAAGIPVVTFDSDSPSSDRLAFIGTENYAAGAAAAKYIGDKLNGTGKVAAVTTTGQSNVNERISGFQETMKSDYPGIQLVQVVDSGTDEVTAATNVASLLSNNKDLDYIFCAVVSASTGSQQALQEAGLTDRTKIVAFDTDNVTLDAIKAGKVEATVSQAPWCEGYWSMIYLYYIEEGLINSVDNWQEKGYPSLPKTADSGASLVTIDTCDNYYTK